MPEATHTADTGIFKILQSRRPHLTPLRYRLMESPAPSRGITATLQPATRAPSAPLPSRYPIRLRSPPSSVTARLRNPNAVAPGEMASRGRLGPHRPSSNLKAPETRDRSARLPSATRSQHSKCCSSTRICPSWSQSMAWSENSRGRRRRLRLD